MGLELNGAEIKIHLLSSGLPFTSAYLSLHAVLPENQSQDYLLYWLVDMLLKSLSPFYRPLRD